MSRRPPIACRRRRSSPRLARPAPGPLAAAGATRSTSPIAARVGPQALARLADAGLAAYVPNRGRRARRAAFGMSPSAALAPRSTPACWRRAAADRRRGRGRAAASPHARGQRRGDLLPARRSGARRRIRSASPGATRSSHPLGRRTTAATRALFSDAVLTYVRLDWGRGRSRAALPRARPGDPLGRPPRRRAGPLRRRLLRAEGNGASRCGARSYPVFPPVICVLAGRRGGRVASAARYRRGDAG